MTRLSSIVCYALLAALAQSAPLSNVTASDDEEHLLWKYEIDDDLSSSVEVDYVNDNPVIEVDDNGMPVCPPPFYNPEACYAKSCKSDLDCLGGKTERACCYNGCVRTCMVKVKPPPLFDYDEDDAHQPAYSPNGVPPPMRPGAAEVAELEGPAIVLSLPGGCHLTQEQYDSYQKFQIASNVQKCYCLAGDVFCQINQKTD